MTVLYSAVNTHPVITSQHAEDDKPDCSNKMFVKDKINECLKPYEQNLIVYRAPDTTDAEREGMKVRFCL